MNEINIKGIFSWYGIDNNFEHRIKAIKRAGFDATMIWLGPEEQSVLAGRTDDMPYIVRDQDLYLENAHAPILKNCNDLWSADCNLAKDIEIQYRGNIKYCGKHHIPVLVMHVTKGNDLIDISRCGIDLLKNLTKYAEDKNVKLAIENTRKSKIVRKIFDLIHSDFLGFCYDSSHDILYSPQSFSLLKQYADRLLCIHLSDTDGTNDSHWLPFQGVLDWDKLARCFPQDYTGVYSLEVVPKNKEEESSFLDNCLKALNRIVNRIEEYHQEKYDSA